MKEADRRGSSCPVLFAWDGHKYKLVTDVIGAAVVGTGSRPQRRNIPNPGEWIKVDGSQVVPSTASSACASSSRWKRSTTSTSCGWWPSIIPKTSKSIPTSVSSMIRRLLRGAWWPRADTRLPVGAWDGEGRDVLDVLEPARSQVRQRIHGHRRTTGLRICMR